MEIGTPGNPLAHPYEPLGPLTTPCWCRSYWETLQHYRYQVAMDYPTILPRRDRDRPIIDVFGE